MLQHNLEGLILNCASICFQEVELKYNELRRAQGESAAVEADVSDSNGSFSVSDQTAD